MLSEFNWLFTDTKKIKLIKTGFHKSINWIGESCTKIQMKNENVQVKRI